MCPRMISSVGLAAVGCALAVAPPARAAPAVRGPETARVVSAAQSTDVGLTIYTAFTEQGRPYGGPERQDVHFALVKDRRRLDVQPGTCWVRFTDVPAAIEPTSVSFRSLSDLRGLRVLEQSYRYDLASRESILRHSVGKRARFRRTLPGRGSVSFEGSLLTPQGDVVRTAEGIVLDPEGSVTLDRLPEGLIRRPELLWKLHAERGGRHTGEIAYFARAVSWRADYRVILAPDDDRLALAGWVTVDNRSGASYRNAALQLVAGDVHRAEEPQVDYVAREVPHAGAMGPGAAAPPQFVEEPFFEYHLYTLQGRTTIADQETKQIQFLDAPGVRARKVFLFDALRPDRPGTELSLPLGYLRIEPGADGGPAPAETHKVRVAMEVRNAEADGLGMPLPKGKIALYKADHGGGKHFIGEDTIGHTPKDEKLRLLIGNAFDLVGTRRVLDTRNEPAWSFSTVEVSLRNAGGQPAEVEVYEHLPNKVTLVESTLPHEAPDAFTLRFLVAVPARGQGRVRYLVKWPV